MSTPAASEVLLDPQYDVPAEEGREYKNALCAAFPNHEQFQETFGVLCLHGNLNNITAPGKALPILAGDLMRHAETHCWNRRLWVLAAAARPNHQQLTSFATHKLGLRIPWSQILELRDELSARPLVDVRTVAQGCVARVLSEDYTLVEILSLLNEYPSNYQGDAPPLLELATLLCARVPAALSLVPTAALQARLARDREGPLRLVLRFDRCGTSDAPAYQVKSYLRRVGQTLDPLRTSPPLSGLLRNKGFRALEAHIAGLLEQDLFVARVAAQNRVVIEFILPVELLDLEVDRLCHDLETMPVRLGRSYQVVLRSWERCDVGFRGRPSWGQRSSALLAGKIIDNYQLPVRVQMRELEADLQRLLGDPSVVGLIPRDPLPKDAKLRKTLYFYSVHSGIPLFLWVRAGAPSGSKLDCILPADRSELPEWLRQKRAELGSSIDEHLSLLWDLAHDPVPMPGPLQDPMSDRDVAEANGP